MPTLCSARVTHTMMSEKYPQIQPPRTLRVTHGETDTMAEKTISQRVVPARISVMTFNVWCSAGKPAKWPAREPAIRRLMQVHSPDIVCLQEVMPCICEVSQLVWYIIDLMRWRRCRITLTSKRRFNLQLPSILCKNITSNSVLCLHSAARKHYDGLAMLCSHPFKEEDEGWSYEGGILWKQTMFELVAHGKESLNITAYPRRGLFWARLRVRGSDQTILVTTVHMPWSGAADEIQTGVNPRIAISEGIVGTIDRLVQEYNGVDEGVVLCGDMNDDTHPARVFTTRGGFIDTQEALLLAPIPTHPCRPSSKREDVKVSAFEDQAPGFMQFMFLLTALLVVLTA